VAILVNGPILGGNRKGGRNGGRPGNLQGAAVKNRIDGTQQVRALIGVASVDIAGGQAEDQIPEARIGRVGHQPVIQSPVAAGSPGEVIQGSEALEHIVIGAFRYAGGRHSPYQGCSRIPIDIEGHGIRATSPIEQHTIATGRLVVDDEVVLDRQGAIYPERRGSPLGIVESGDLPCVIEAAVILGTDNPRVRQGTQGSRIVDAIRPALNGPGIDQGNHASRVKQAHIGSIEMGIEGALIDHRRATHPTGVPQGNGRSPWGGNGHARVNLNRLIISRDL